MVSEARLFDSDSINAWAPQDVCVEEGGSVLEFEDTVYPG